MQRLNSALAGAAVALALAAGSAPAQAASLQPAPAVLTSEQPAGSIQMVGDRDHWKWRHHGRHHRFRDRDHFRLGFGFGFGAPFFGGHPYAYSYRPYRYAYQPCPYGYWFDGYACIPTHRPIYRTYPYHVGPGINLEYRERGF
jgi:hypothetical protein